MQIKERRKIMVAKLQSDTKPDRTVIDQKEQELKKQGLIEIDPLQQPKPGQYRRSQEEGGDKSFDGPTNYTIDWCTDE